MINDWDQKCSFQQLTTLLAATKKLPIKPVIIIDCSYFFYEDLKEISSYLSALIFDPYCIFHLSGIVVVGISEQLQGTIKPVILGGGAGHPLTENHYQTNQYPQGMEAGTGNYPKIYLLQHYFAYYAKHFQDIVQN